MAPVKPPPAAPREVGKRNTLRDIPVTLSFSRLTVTAQIKKSYEQNQSFAENHPELPTIPAAQ
jgi:hypothetical protein